MKKNMSWKDLNYAKKGFIIGLIYGILSSIISYIITLQGTSAIKGNLVIIILSIIFSWPLFVGLIFFAPFYYLGVLINSSFLLILAYFITDNLYFFGTIGLALLGTAIGWLIGKYKKK